MAEAAGKHAGGRRQLYGVRECRAFRTPQDIPVHLTRCRQHGPARAGGNGAVDFMGRELSIVYHENGKEFKVSYVYDKNGTLLQETGRDGTVIYYTYDARNRLIQKKQVKDAEQRIWKTAYGYEWTAGEKELLSVLRQESPGGSVDETYMDQAGKTVRTCSGGLMTENEYDKDGRVTAQRITSEDGSIKGSTTVTLHDAEGSVAG